MSDDLDKDIEELMGENLAKRVQDMKHGDALLSGGANKYESVNQKLATAVTDPEEQYRQALLLSTFLSRDDARKVVAALDERRRYGVDITPVVDLITSWCAVVGATGGRVQSLVETQTHQSLTTNIPSAIKDKLFNKNKKDSPLS